MWGTAAAVALMVTWALPWARTSDTSEGPDAEYFTLWHLSERSYNALATPVHILLYLMMITIIVLLTAAAKATAASYIAAGVTAGITTADEIHLWPRIGSVIGQTAHGIMAATLLTIAIAIIFTTLGLTSGSSAFSHRETEGHHRVLEVVSCPAGSFGDVGEAEQA